MGFIIGPLLGGVLGQFGFRVPFFGSAVLALANVVFGLFILPESSNLKTGEIFPGRGQIPSEPLKYSLNIPS
ncbi:MAG: hypothetical protein IPI30_22530 [Saprospiraceae bacterium]|nr:hypothetical protein [Candidatus Vicinibacter affinis]